MAVPVLFILSGPRGARTVQACAASQRRSCPLARPKGAPLDINESRILQPRARSARLLSPRAATVRG